LVGDGECYFSGVDCVGERGGWLVALVEGGGLGGAGVHVALGEDGVGLVVGDGGGALIARAMVGFGWLLGRERRDGAGPMFGGLLLMVGGWKVSVETVLVEWSRLKRACWSGLKTKSD